MEPSSQDERELRAARNQALFRSLNEKLREVSDALASMADEYVIACECANVNCVDTLSIRAHEYRQIRANPRHFAVLHGHVYPEVEVVVGETQAYVVVEKIAKAAEVAEAVR
jgi:5-bromo-4-chloroindolyl phosphate hydrolysis protein